MIVNQITSTAVELEITDVTLLEVEEYGSLADGLIPDVGQLFWLKSSSEGDGALAGTVAAGHWVAQNITSNRHGVRPALKIQNTNLSVGDKFTLAGYQWTVILEDTALCDAIVARVSYRKNWRANDAHDYDASDVKAWLAAWTKEKSIDIVS